MHEGIHRLQAVAQVLKKDFWSWEKLEKQSRGQEELFAHSLSEYWYLSWHKRAHKICLVKFIGAHAGVYSSMKVYGNLSLEQR